MALLPVVADKVSLDGGAVAPADTYWNGLRWAGEKVRGSAGLTIAGYSQGLPVDANGVLCLVDATGGMPAGVRYLNGFPLAPTGLCTSSNPMATYNNGIPMAANGAVCV